LLPSTFVVPLDGSDFSLRALPFASWWAQRFDADVFAMTTPQTIDDTERLRLPAWLDTLRSCARLTTALIDDDDPAHAIAQVVAARPRAAVCMATHGRGLVGSLALGNLCERVLRTVNTPVLLVGRHCVDAPKVDGPVVVCHDGSAAADAIVAPARVWADAAGLAVVVAHVYRPSETSTAKAREALRQMLDALGRSARVELIAGSFPAGSIRDVAHELDASLIAMSTHGHTGATAIAMGSVTSWVTRESMCPVLTIRPPRLDQ
jgi:nucleotide-binding universal stress UspA family protein